MIALIKIVRSAIILAAIGATLFFALRSPTPSVWVATPEDKTVSALVDRWAQSHGRIAKWEALADFPILDAKGLNKAARLRSATSLPTALDGLMATLARVDTVKDGRVGPSQVGYFACYYPNGAVAVVVRSGGQPSCSSL